MPDSLDKQRKCRRGLPPAWIAQMIAPEGRTPVRQNPDQFSAGQMRLDMWFSQVRQAEALQSGVKQCAGAVGEELRFHAHIQLAPVLLELPGELATGTHRAKVDAGVACEILRRPRSLAARKVGWRADGGHAQVRTDLDRDHVFCDQLPGRMPASNCPSTMSVRSLSMTASTQISGYRGRISAKAGDRIMLAANSVVVMRMVCAARARQLNGLCDGVTDTRRIIRLCCAVVYVSCSVTAAAFSTMAEMPPCILIGNLPRFRYWLIGVHRR
jgi:hypothetical protein